MIRTNYLKSQNLQNKDIKKQKKRSFLRFFISLFCIFYISINLIVIDSYKVYAGSLEPVLDLGGGLAALSATGVAGTLVSAEALIPMILVALGVAGIGYVAGKNNIVEGVVDDLKAEGSDFVKQVKDSRGVLRDYIVTRYIDGKNYVDKKILEITAKYGLDNGLFDGVNEVNGINFPYEINLGDYEIGTEADYNILIGVASGIHYSYTSMSYKLIEYINNSGIDLSNYMVYQFVGNSVPDSQQRSKLEYLRFIPKGLSRNILNEIAVAYAPNTFHRYRIDENIPYIDIVYRPLLNENVYTNTGTISVIDIGYGVVGDCLVSSIGVTVDDYIEGLPITDNIPKEVAGDIVLPNWISIAIENLFPVSLPDSYKIPAIFNPDLTLDIGIGISIPWVDPFPYPLPDNPALPDEQAQEKAQEGITDSVPSTPAPSNTEGTFNSMLVPADIRKKYPFSLVYDFYDCWSILWYGVNPDSADIGFKEIKNEKSIKAIANNSELLRLAPVYEWKPPVSVNGFTNMEPVVVDLSKFDTLASIFRGLFLIIWTTNMWLAGYKIMTGNQ